MDTGLDQDWLAAALETTGRFETAGPAATDTPTTNTPTTNTPWGSVAGDFDGMGLSCGVLQWNIGANTLQPLVQAAGEAAVRAAMPRHGAQFWEASTAPVPRGLAIVRAWQGGGSRLPAGLREELVAFLTSEPMVAQQMAAAGRVARLAARAASTWAVARGGGVCSKRDFCWFFDLVTQNGGLKGLTLADVEAFVARQGGLAAAVGAICDWLAAMPDAHAGFRDCRRNAALWRAPGSDLSGDLSGDLFVLSYLRARKARPRYAGTVMNRKGAIACRQGWVNGRLMDFTGRF